jgi:hypothetical protein
MTRLPDDAFQQYVNLGPTRSYDALAKRLGVAKRSITRLAARERWQERLAAIETQARERLDEKLVETIEAVNARHVKVFRAVLAKGLQALSAMPLSSAEAAVRAIEVAVRGERLVLGEPSDRSAVSFEEVARREFERWMPTVEDIPDGDDGGLDHGKDDDATTAGSAERT